MTIAPGARLGPYEITAAIGAGGMGEVFRATDTTLGREVALKLLPEDFADDDERHARFEREARLLASLNHPNIAVLHALEHLDGQHALVMELVEGEGLDELIARGPVPVDEALPIARQVAEALEAAHEHGIVHRDLKPANVRIRPDGTVKVLDFGLAKAWDAGGESGLTHSPTITRAHTADGIILGSAAYMAPEQARGRMVDRRADIWAFGVVLYEMLTASRMFEGETVTDVLANVLKQPPDWNALPTGTPAPVRHLLHRCLDRDLRRRLQAIGEARVVLEDPSPQERAIDEAPARASRRLLAPALAGGLALLAAGWLLRPAPTVVQPPVRFVDVAAAGLDTVLGRMPTISPEGSRVAYSVGGSLWVRSLGEPEASELPGALDARYSTWSPDGRALAFTRGGRAWRISADGGEATDLGPVPVDLVGSGGGAWTADGRIVFAGSDTVGLWAVPARGGEGSQILALDRSAESDFHEISALPDARGLIFTVHRRGQPPDTIDLYAGGARREVVQIAGESLRHPVYSPTGHIVYERETTNPGIWAVSFSLDRMATTGEPFLVVPGGSAPSLASDGTLCFVRPDERVVELVRVSRQGVAETVAELAGTTTSMLAHLPTGMGYQAAGGLTLSPDGGRVALSLGYSPGQLLVFDLARGTLSRVATDVFPSRPVWTKDGKRLVYASAHGARAWNLAWRRADAAEDEARLSTSDEVQMPLALSPDGAHLVFAEGSGPKGQLKMMTLGTGADAGPVFATGDFPFAASFSPDGRWLAYDSLASGRSEVFARPFPRGDQRFQISTDGGESPVWSPSGEILYLGNGALWSVSVNPRGDSLAFAKPELLFRTGEGAHLANPFDVTRDGKSFYMLRVRGSEHVSLILNWPRQLTRRAALAGEQTTRGHPGG